MTISLELNKRYFCSEEDSFDKIIGEVSNAFAEYFQGARFFSEKGHLYTEDGRNIDYGPTKDLNYIDTGRFRTDSQTPLIWTHDDDSAFFSNISELSLGKHYLNEMGYIVHITGCLSDIGSGPFFVGHDLKHYLPSGKLVISSKHPMRSIYDLIREVEFPKFAESVVLDTHSVDPTLELRYGGEDTVFNDPKKEDTIFTLMEEIGLALHTAKKLGVKLSINIES